MLPIFRLVSSKNGQLFTRNPKSEHSPSGNKVAVLCRVAICGAQIFIGDINPAKMSGWNGKSAARRVGGASG